MSRPPRLAAALLAAILPATLAGRSTLGDVLEEYHRRRPGIRRRLWFWAATLDLARRYLPARAAASIGSVASDVAFTARIARRTPGLTIATVTTLSLAVGAGTAAFTVVNGSSLRQLLAVDPAVVAAWRMRDNGGSLLWPTAELLALRGRTSRRTIEGAAIQTLPVGGAPDGATDARVLAVTGTYFQTFRASAFIGRVLDESDDRPGAAPVAVVDHLYWRRVLAGNPRIVSSTLFVDGAAFTVVGVAGRDFVDPSHRGPNLWVPLRSGPAATPPSLMMLTRLQPDASMAEADRELTGLLADVSGLSPASPPVRFAQSGPVAGVDVVAAARLVVWTGVLIIALVLVLACANVSNLQLAGIAARTQEMAIRRSCGASRWRLGRQLAVESGALALVSGGIGWLLARLSASWMATGMGMPDADVDPDLRTYAFLLVVTLVAAVGIAVAPAVLSTRDGMATSLKSGAPVTGMAVKSNRTRSVFLGVQAAAAIVIVSLSALFVRTLVHLQWTGPGYDVSRLVNVSVRLAHDDVGQKRAAAFWTDAIERVRRMPGVDGASLALAPPFGKSFGDPDAIVDNDTDEAYFDAIGLRLAAGRTYTAAEVAARAPLAVISEAIARRFWPDGNPVGSSAARINQRYAKHTVIGVVADAMAYRVHAGGAPTIYMPGIQADWAQLTVRTADPRAMAPAIREAIRAISPDVQPTVQVVADRYDREWLSPRRYAGLAVAAAALTLALSVVGLAGVTMFAVQSRRREIGVRLALGARRGEVIALLLRDGLRPAVVGVIVGVGGAWLASRYVSNLLYGLSEHDPLALVGAVALLLGTAVAAGFVPTRRAARLDPAVILREG